MKHRTTSFTVCVHAGVLALAVFAQMGHAATYSGGAGTNEDPWQIANVADWMTLIDSPDDWDKHFILVADIDFQGATLTPIAPQKGESSQFEGVPFKGTFDGRGHVLRNAQIKLPGNHFVALFGYVGIDAVICNLGVEDVEVTGDAQVGGLAGTNFNGEIRACYATGVVTGNRHVGGLVGRNAGAITSCYATGAVTGSDEVGGLVGYNYGSITNCYATGAIAGSGGGVGGLVGESLLPVTSCFWDMDTTGQETSEWGAGLPTTEMMQRSTFVEWDFVDVWDIVENTTYPFLRSYSK